MGWQKRLLTAIVASGNRYRYEGRSGYGSAIRVSNGTTRWNYHVDDHKYTEKVVFANDTRKGRIIPQEENAAIAAETLITQIRTLPTRLKSAKFLKDEAIVINGERMNSYVIQFSDADFKTRRPNYTMEEKLWVDKSRMVIVKIANRNNGYLILGGSEAHIPLETEETTIFDVVRLDEREPDSSFVFSPPPSANLVESFPDPFAPHADFRATNFLGKPAPDIHFGRGGRDTSLNTYRGKPVFIEFWATWCAPCVELTPELKQLYTDTASKGLVWLTFDIDEDPSTADSFVKQEHIPWSNYHDEDGTIGKAFGREGIPLGILVDAQGKVSFYESGYDVSKLRAAIAKLSPEFSSVAPKNEEKEGGRAKSQQ